MALMPAMDDSYMLVVLICSPLITEAILRYLSIQCTKDPMDSLDFLIPCRTLIVGDFARPGLPVS